MKSSKERDYSWDFFLATCSGESPREPSEQSVFTQILIDFQAVGVAEVNKEIGGQKTSLPLKKKKKRCPIGGKTENCTYTYIQLQQSRCKKRIDKSVPVLVRSRTTWRWTIHKHCGSNLRSPWR